MTQIFYFDFISPYAYLAWKDLKKKNLLKNFVLKPIALGSVFSKIGQTPVTEVTSKRDYLYEVAKENALENNINLCLPFQHPFNSLYLLRLSCLHLQESPETAIEIIDKYWDYTWAKKIDVSNPEEISKQLETDGYQKAKEYLEDIFKKSVKINLKSNVKEALEHRVFGVPSFIIESQLHWGFDRIPKFQAKILNMKGKV